MSIAEKLLVLKEDMDTLYEKGKNAAIQAFSDACQNNGDRTNYYQAFVQTTWSDETFSYIRYPIVCKGITTAAQSVFYRCLITKIHVPVIVEGITAREMFYYANLLEEISDLRFINVPSFQNTFTGCVKLRHMIVGGSIDVDFNISATAVLDEESCQSIIDHLKDLTGLEKQTLTFHATVGGKLTLEEPVTMEIED